jgi:hypothetical protein
MDIQLGVVPSNAALASRGICGIHFVKDIRRLVAKNTEAMSEAGRYPQETAVQVRELYAEAQPK